MRTPSPDGAVAPDPPHVAERGPNDATAARPDFGRSSVAPPLATPGGDAGSPRTAGQVVKDILLFFAGPFVTMAYLATFPYLAMKILLDGRRQRKASG